MMTEFTMLEYCDTKRIINLKNQHQTPEQLRKQYLVTIRSYDPYMQKRS